MTPETDQPEEGAPELFVDDTVEQEVEGKIYSLQEVEEREEQVVGRHQSHLLDHFRFEENQNFRRNDERHVYSDDDDQGKRYPVRRRTGATASSVAHRAHAH